MSRDPPEPLETAEARAAIAVHVLNGLCSAIEDYSPGRILNYTAMAEEAVGLADALLAELNKR